MKFVLVIFLLGGGGVHTTVNVDQTMNFASKIKCEKYASKILQEIQYQHKYNKYFGYSVLCIEK